MNRKKRYILCFMTLIVVVLFCSHVPSSLWASSFVICEKAVPDFWGGAACGQPNGTCRKCCNILLCLQSYEPICDTYSGNKKACLDNKRETRPITGVSGYSCEDTGKAADSCTKSNWDNCAKRHVCYWSNAASACCWDSDNWYYRQAYINCVP